MVREADYRSMHFFFSLRHPFVVLRLIFPPLWFERLTSARIRRVPRPYTSFPSANWCGFNCILDLPSHAVRFFFFCGVHCSMKKYRFLVFIAFIWLTLCLMFVSHVRNPGNRPFFSSPPLPPLAARRVEEAAVFPPGEGQARRSMARDGGRGLGGPRCWKFGVVLPKVGVHST